MTKQKQKIMAIAIIGGLLCIVSLLALHVGTIMIPIGGGIRINHNTASCSAVIGAVK